MPTSLELKKELKAQQEGAKGYRRTPEDKAAQEFFAQRKQQLMENRRNKKVEEIWKAADKAYVPHTIDGTPGKKVLVSDDENGWRSSQQILNKDDAWVEDSVPPNPYIKIQTALGIIVDRNPTAVFSPGAKKYKKNNELMADLYRRSWEIAHSKSAFLKPFVFNQAKYGMGVGRTYPLTVKRTVSDLSEYNPKTGKNKYVPVEHTYYDDIFRESMSPWQCWFDDAAVVGNPFSCNDNMWYKDYSWDKLKEQFGHLPNFKFVNPTEKVLSPVDNAEGATQTKGVAAIQERVWFYENLGRDMFYVETEDGIVLVNEPIPKRPKNKRLSLFTAPWTLRNDRDIEGIGVYEAMRNDHKLHMKIRNMTMDQLVLSIYKEFFYEGTDTLEADGQMKTAPGRGRQVTNPQNVKWNEIPGPGRDAWMGLEIQENAMEEATGITKGLSGEVTGKTAFEISQAREAALKRLKTPLENITDALEIDAYISMGIIEDLYAIPKIKLIAEDRYIELFELDQMTEDNDGVPPEFEEEYKEIPLKLEREKETGTIVKSQKEDFFTLKPEDLSWEGVIVVKGQSIIADSELLERTTTIEMANIVIPLLTAPPEVAKKPAIQIIETYKKDPRDWLPDAWFVETPPGQEMFVKAGAEQDPNAQDPNAETVVPPSDIAGPTNPAADIANIMKT